MIMETDILDNPLNVLIVDTEYDKVLDANIEHVYYLKDHVGLCLTIYSVRSFFSVWSIIKQYNINSNINDSIFDLCGSELLDLFRYSFKADKLISRLESPFMLGLYRYDPVSDTKSAVSDAEFAVFDTKSALDYTKIYGALHEIILNNPTASEKQLLQLLIKILLPKIKFVYAQVMDQRKQAIQKDKKDFNRGCSVVLWCIIFGLVVFFTLMLSNA